MDNVSIEHVNVYINVLRTKYQYMYKIWGQCISLDKQINTIEYEK